MNNGLRALMVVVPGCVLGVALSCIIPDRDIIVVVTDPCGEEYAVQTVGAYGYNIHGVTVDIKTEGGEWLSTSYCLNAEQAEQFVDPTSELASDALYDIVLRCQQRAFEMGIADLDYSCTTTADIAYIGQCQQPPAGCSEPDSGTGGAEGGGETTEASAQLWTLDLQAEVSIVDGETVVSDALISAALADPVGLLEDGTTATQVSDARGTPRGFEITGVHADNLGGVLGLRDGDVIVAINGQATATLDDLLALGLILLEVERTSVLIERGEDTIELRYRRGSSG